jgi:steroid delta-isomerase-like uncharacterized protein
MGILESNKKVVLAYVDAMNRGDIDAMDRLFTQDALIYGVLGWGPLDLVKGIWNELHAAFDMKLAVESIVAEDDTVAVRFTERGTFNAPFRGRAPTKASYEMVAMEFFEMKDGLIHRRWGARDTADQQRQLGTV